MSLTALLDSVSACSETGSDRPPLDWLLTMLKQAMEETMASEAKPLQKANAIARLGNLYLKACGASELKKEIAALKRRIEQLEPAEVCDAVPASVAPAPPATLAAPQRRLAQAPRPRHVKRR
jgi:hypothetical protein